MREVALTLIVAAVLLFVGLGRVDLWAPDEPRYAEVAREMVITGDYAVPHLNGEVYDRKPPLLFWMSALSFKLMGVSEGAARFPVAVTAFLTVVVVLAGGWLLFDVDVGVVAALVLTTTYWFVWLGRRVKMDVPVTLFTTLAILLFFMAYRRNRSWLYIPAFISVGVGGIAKGPVAFSVPFITMVLFHAIIRDFGFLRKKAFWFGLLLSLLVYLFWMVPASLKYGFSYVVSQVYSRTSALFLHTKVHKHGFLYYFIHFPLNTLPWVLLFPAALKRCLDCREKEEFLLLLCWFVGNFLFFSLAKTKRSTYLIPIYPAYALMVAAYLKDAGSHVVERFSRIVAGMALMVSLLGLLFSLYNSSIAGVVGGLALGLATFIFYRRRYTGLWGVSTLLALTLLLALNLWVPLYNPCKSVKEVSLRARKLVDKGHTLYLYGIGNSHAGGFNFYTGIVPIPLLGRGENMCVHRGGVFITKGRYFDRLIKRFNVEKIYQQPCGHRFVLFRCKPDGGGT